MVVPSAEIELNSGQGDKSTRWKGWQILLDIESEAVSTTSTLLRLNSKGERRTIWTLFFIYSMQLDLLLSSLGI